MRRVVDGLDVGNGLCAHNDVGGVRQFLLRVYRPMLFFHSRLGHI